MADKVDKPKKQKKAKPDEKGVLAALPSTRPQRIGTRRAASPPAPKTTTATRASKAAATSAPAKPAAKKAAAKATARKKSAAAAKPRVTAARRKAAAPRTFEPTQAAEAAAGAADAASLRSSPQPAGAGARAAGAATPPVREEPTYPRPRPVREGARGIGTTGYRDGHAEESGRPSGVELAATAVRAAGEVAQLSISLGGAVLKRVTNRLPKP